MTDIKDLYQQIIIDHNKSPRNFGVLATATHEAHGDNPLCGDKVDVYIKIDEDIVSDISFDGEGCAISIAAGSMMTEAIKGKTKKEALELFEAVHATIVKSSDQDIGKLDVFKGVKEFPSRVKCVTMAWHTLKEVIEGSSSKGIESEGENNE